MSNDIKKCRYLYCQHPNREINLKTDDYVLIGQRKYYHKDCKMKCSYSCCKHGGMIDLAHDEYLILDDGCWHKDCKEESELVLKIVDYWNDHIDPDIEKDSAEFSHLRKVIQDLIFDGYDLEYIFFALKRSAKFLHHPPGLKYAVKNDDAKLEWKKKKIAEEAKKMEMVKPEDKVESFQSKRKKKGSFSDIFGGG